MAETREIAFNSGDASGIDELSGGGRLINALVDATGAVRSRPGITTWDDFPADTPSSFPVVGMGLFNDTIIFVTEDNSVLGSPVREVFAWMGFQRGDVIALSVNANSFVDGTTRPSIVVMRENVIIVGGGAPQRVTSGYISERLGGSPPDSSDVVAVGQYLVLSKADTSGQFVWAGPGEAAIETWDIGIDFREAEYRPDALLALSETSRELWAHGAKTCQGFEPDEQQVWAPSFSVDVGISAPRSIIPYEGMRAWLDHNRRFVMTNGRNIDPSSWISSPALDKTVQRLGTISDCWGFRAKIDGHDLLCWVFPTEGRTFVYDIISKVWGEWFGFTNGTWSPFAVQSYLYWPEKNLHLVGLSDGTIGRLTFEATSDLGVPLKWLARSRFDSGKTGARKDPTSVKLVFRRGEAADTDASIELRWRDDIGSWSDSVFLNFNEETGTANPAVEARPVGEPYDVRQYEIATTADVATSIAEAWELFDLLEA